MGQKKTKTKTKNKNVTLPELFDTKFNRNNVERGKIDTHRALKYMNAQFSDFNKSGGAKIVL